MPAHGDAPPELDRYEEIIDDFEAFLNACTTPLPSVLRVNELLADPDDVVAAWEPTDIDVDRFDWHDGLLAVNTDTPGNTWPYVHGWVHGQEAVSALPAEVLAPDAMDRVLDLCAAPGSKTTQLAGLQDDRGTIVANDVDLGRLSALRSNCDRLGVTSTIVTNRDGRHLAPNSIGIEEFDRVLVDAPCSCEGTIRKNPDTFDEWSLEYIESITAVQRDLLENAIAVTRPGGVVVYATCTFAPEENEAVLDSVLTRDDCRIVEFDLPIDYSTGVTSWQGDEFNPSVENCARIYPHHNDTGGFFIAKLEVVG